MIIYKQYKKLELDKLYLLSNIFPENINEKEKLNYTILTILVFNIPSNSIIEYIKSKNIFNNNLKENILEYYKNYYHYNIEST